jgi:hypothetical protein
MLKDTETTITVSWMGGGQVKDRKSQPHPCLDNVLIVLSKGFVDTQFSLCSCGCFPDACIEMPAENMVSR